MSNENKIRFVAAVNGFDLMIYKATIESEPEEVLNQDYQNARKLASDELSQMRSVAF